MSLEYYAFVAIVAFALGWVFSPTEVHKREVKYEKPKNWPNEDHWTIRVFPTDDPSIYRAVYRMRGSTRYDVTGRGVTGAMKKLIKRIEP